MNDLQFAVLESQKKELTIESVLFLHTEGICTVCEDGNASYFDFEDDDL